MQAVAVPLAMLLASLLLAGGLGAGLGGCAELRAIARCFAVDHDQNRRCT